MLNSPDTYDLFVRCLEDMRRRFAICLYLSRRPRVLS